MEGLGRIGEAVLDERGQPGVFFQEPGFVQILAQIPVDLMPRLQDLEAIPGIQTQFRITLKAGMQGERQAPSA